MLLIVENFALEYMYLELVWILIIEVKKSN